ncbi:MAG: phytanoyl-CoA dioxygenase family protein [Proteobacteria bacterium]|nr:phytanoyl-CoA dioxygenase family protein [Pseudomonadota bacterium]
MNKELPRSITEEEIETYARDGVVCIRGLFDRDWVESLLAAWDRVVADPSAYGLITAAKERGIDEQSGAVSIKHLCRAVPEFKAYMQESPAAEIVGRLMGARKVGFFYDQIFAKEPRSDTKTVWHHDAPGWPVAGNQLPSFWMPLTPISRENSLECLGGMHTIEELYWPPTRDSMRMQQPKDREVCPDFDARRDDPSLTFLWWEMEPGDALLIHSRSLHYSAGNLHPTQRRVALSTRWYGDDVFWSSRPECVPGPPGVDFREMPEGERPAPPDFPIVWSDPDFFGAA